MHERCARVRNSSLCKLRVATSITSYLAPYLYYWDRHEQLLLLAVSYYRITKGLQA
jgi:hypothetical protein